MGRPAHYRSISEVIDGLEDYLTTPNPPAPPTFTDGTQPCRSQSPDPKVRQWWADQWFPEKGESTRRPVELCNSCPFRIQCLAWAVHNELDGIWAGTGRDGRIAIRKELGIQLSSPQSGGPTDSQILAERRRNAKISVNPTDHNRDRIRGPKGYFIGSKPAKDQETAA